MRLHVVCLSFRPRPDFSHWQNQVWQSRLVNSCPHSSCCRATPVGPDLSKPCKWACTKVVFGYTSFCTIIPRLQKSEDLEWHHPTTATPLFDQEFYDNMWGADIPACRIPGTDRRPCLSNFTLDWVRSVWLLHNFHSFDIVLVLCFDNAGTCHVHVHGSLWRWLSQCCLTLNMG